MSESVRETEKERDINIYRYREIDRKIERERSKMTKLPRAVVERLL